MSIITYPLNGVTYDAEDVSTYLCTRTSGVYSKDTNYAVSVTGARQITVAPGLAWVNYDDFKGVSACSNLTVPDADSTLPRIDRVVLQFDTAANLTAVKLKPGTPAAAPEPPAILQNHNQYELGLCTVSVPAGSSVVTAADITDTRADEAVCGVMRDGVTGIPTGTLVQQFRAVIDALKGEAADKLGYYPVGSIYQSTDPTSPAALFGGSWEEIASERVLMGASSTHAAGSTVKAGLPNLKGSSSGVASTAYPNLSNSGALSMNTNNGGLAGYEGGSYGSNCTVSFDASKSNAIYGRSSTVQPAAYYVHIWHRVA